MTPQTLSLEEQPKAPEASPTGLLLLPWQKGVLLVVLLGLLYLRFWRRK